MFRLVWKVPFMGKCERCSVVGCILVTVYTVLGIILMTRDRGTGRGGINFRGSCGFKPKMPPLPQDGHLPDPQWGPDSPCSGREKGA